MTKLSFFSFIIFASAMFTCIADNDLLYNPSFLTQFKEVRPVLIRKGFKEVDFKTPDGLMLKGLFLKRPNATCNVIVGAGWLPGKKENMATFYDILPHYCNILLFEARGHGESEGPLLREIWRYGVHEYKDFLGALSYMHHNNQLPNFICGICSGAFNATRAAVFLTQHNLIDAAGLKGLIFDSGWGSVTKISHSVFMGGIEKRILNLFARVYATNNQDTLKKLFTYRLCCYGAQKSYTILHTLFFKPLIMLYEKQTNLFQSIHTLTVPLFFIHSYDDTCAAIDEVQKLAAIAPHKQCWWITQDSYHAKNHIKQRNLYKKKVSEFISQVLDI